MKPSWDTAPEWANYVAQDERGCWWWYESKPRKGFSNWMEAEGRAAPVIPENPNWKESLEKRP